MPSPNQPRAYRLRTTAEVADYHIVAAPSAKQAKADFAMYLVNSNEAQRWLHGLSLIRCCDRAPVYDSWAAGVGTGTIKTEEKVRELIRK